MLVIHFLIVGYIVQTINIGLRSAVNTMPFDQHFLDGCAQSNNKFMRYMEVIRPLLLSGVYLLLECYIALGLELTTDTNNTCIALGLDNVMTYIHIIPGSIVMPFNQIFIDGGFCVNLVS